jgi:hypothetical protein
MRAVVSYFILRNNMFELSQEQLLMYSDDSSVRLTTHRIIYNIHGRTEQIMLEDYEGFEFYTAHVGTYKGLMIFFHVITLLLILLLWAGWSKEGVSIIEILTNSILTPLILLSAVTFYLYRLSRRYYLRLIGKFTSIEVRLRTRRHKSIIKFLDKVRAQSDIQRAKNSGNLTKIHA